jgi:hypothetical protein
LHKVFIAAAPAVEGAEEGDDFRRRGHRRALAVLAEARNALAVGAPAEPGLRIFSPLPAAIRAFLA